jgi:hypothetical protein
MALEASSSILNLFKSVPNKINDLRCMQICCSNMIAT